MTSKTCIKNTSYELVKWYVYSLLRRIPGFFSLRMWQWSKGVREVTEWSIRLSGRKASQAEGEGEPSTLAELRGACRALSKCSSALWFCCSVAKSCWPFVTPWTEASQPPLSPRVCSDSSVSRWCYLTISLWFYSCFNDPHQSRGKNMS